MACFMCDSCGKTYNRKDNLRCHIVEVHCSKKKQCKYCKQQMRSPSLKRHMKYSCLVRKQVLKAKMKSKEQATNEEKIVNEPNITVETKEIESDEAFFRSFLKDPDHDPLIDGSKYESLKNNLSQYLNFKN